MAMSNVDVFAERVAMRADHEAVGFDPTVIITLLTTLLPMLMSCFKKNDAADPKAVKAEIRRQNATHPKQLLRRTSAAIRRQSDTPLSREQADALADAVIEQALEEDPHFISGAFAEVA